MSTRSRAILVAAVLLGLGAAAGYTLRKREATPYPTASARAPTSRVLVALPIEEAELASKHWWNWVAIEPLGLLARVPGAYATCTALDGVTRCQDVFKVSWSIRKDHEPADVDQRIDEEEKKLRLRPMPAHVGVTGTYTFARVDLAGFKGYVTTEYAGRGGIVVAFQGFRDDPKLGAVVLSVVATQDKNNFEVDMLAYVLSTTRRHDAELALSPEPDAPAAGDAERRAEVLNDDEAGWGAWSQSARELTAFVDSAGVASAASGLVEPLKRRLEQHEVGPRWETFARAAPFAIALSHWARSESKALLAHLAVVSERASTARRARAADAIAWSLYQCELTERAARQGAREVVPVLARSIAETDSDPFFEEGSAWFGCLADLGWDPEIARQLDAWLSPERKLPRRTDFAGLATELADHVLDSESLRKHVLRALSDTALHGAYRFGRRRRLAPSKPSTFDSPLRVCDHYAASASSIAPGALRVYPGTRVAERDGQIAALRAWLEEQPIHPRAAPETPAITR